MGYGLFPEYRPNVKEAMPNYDGKDLLGAIEALDGLAREAGLPTLSSFAPAADVPHGADADPSEWRMSDEWFLPSDALRVVDGLIASISAGGRREDVDPVLDELRELSRVLRIAEAAGALFRLRLM